MHVIKLHVIKLHKKYQFTLFSYKKNKTYPDPRINNTIIEKAK